MTQSKVEIYTTPTCPYCVRAKNLLMKKKVAFEEIDVSVSVDNRDEMIRRTEGKRSVPQIFIDDRHVGGCDALFELDENGFLDGFLFGSKWY